MATFREFSRFVDEIAARDGFGERSPSYVSGPSLPDLGPPPLPLPSLPDLRMPSLLDLLKDPADPVPGFRFAVLYSDVPGDAGAGLVLDHEWPPEEEREEKMKTTTAYGKIGLRCGKTGAACSSDLAAERETSHVLPPELGRLAWTDARVEGPAPVGRLTLDLVNGRSLHFDVKKELREGQADSWSVGRSVNFGGGVLRLRYETATAVTSEGELVFGRAPVVYENFDALLRRPNDDANVKRELRRRIDALFGEQLSELARVLGFPGRPEETDAELRERLIRAVGPDADGTKPTGPTISARCPNPVCDRTVVVPVGEVDPREYHCKHVFSWRPELRTHGAFVCRGCLIEVSMRDIQDAGADPGKRYDAAGNTLADAAQALRDENRTVLAENARLRRDLEKALSRVPLVEAPQRRRR